MPEKKHESPCDELRSTQTEFKGVWRVLDEIKAELKDVTRMLRWILLALGIAAAGGKAIDVATTVQQATAHATPEPSSSQK